MTDEIGPRVARPTRSPHAGPKEQLLFRVVGAAPDQLDTTATEWDNDADTLSEIAAKLTRQAEALRAGYPSKPAGAQQGAGELAAQAYEKLARAMLRREDEMRNVVQGLRAASDVVAASAPAKARALPPIDEVSMTTPDVGNPQYRQRWEDEHQRETADLEASKNAREAAAAAALRELDGEFLAAAEKMGTTIPHEPAPSGGDTSGGSTPLASAPPPRGSSATPHLIGQPDVDLGPVDGGDDSPDLDPGDPDLGDVDVGLDDNDNDGDLSGGPTVDPTATPATTGSTPAPSPGIGGTGAIGAIGAAALSGAGAGSIAGSRGAAPAARSRSTVALGRSSGAAPKGGTLGRTGVVASSQNSTTGRGTGGRGAAGSRGVVAGSGQAGRSGSTGSAGSRSGGGARVASTSAGATGRRAPLSAASTGGRRGTRDKDGQDRDGMAFDDEQAWLDDEQTGDAVLD